ncbi:hypothetical protein C8J56DRAFT_1064293 [Mycena floridula]|nr:hypothetical protein C8J56DRAFT_1064293 [Mycena floridula]
MNVPAEFTILNISGSFTMNKSLSDFEKTDTILGLQGAIQMANGTLSIKHFKDDAGIEHIRVDQTLSGVIRRPTSTMQPPPPPPPALYSAGFQAPASAGFQSSPSSTGKVVEKRHLYGGRCNLFDRAPGYAAPPAPVQGYTSPGSYRAQPAVTYTPAPASYSTPASSYSTPASNYSSTPASSALTPAQAYQQRYSNRSVSPAPGPQPSYAIPVAPTGYSGGQGQAAPQYSATGGGQGYSNQQGGGDWVWTFAAGFGVLES